MKSMTGFGRGAVVESGFAVTVELKTVNNRFLDVALRLSSEMQQLESTIKRLIGNRLSRGRVDVNLQFDRAEEVNYELNRPLIEGYLSAIRTMQSEFSLSGEPDLNVVARLPNVLVPRKEELSDEFIVAVESAVNFAIDDLEKMLMGWIRRIMINTAIDELRKMKMTPEIGGIPEYVWEVPDNSQRADQLSLYKDLIIIIKRLPPQYRIVFNMYVIDGYSHYEIADALQFSVGTSKSTLSRARVLLQKFIKQEEGAKVWSL